MGPVRTVHTGVVTLVKPNWVEQEPTGPRSHDHPTSSNGGLPHSSHDVILHCFLDHIHANSKLLEFTSYSVCSWIHLVGSQLKKHPASLILHDLDWIELQTEASLFELNFGKYESSAHPNT